MTRRRLLALVALPVLGAAALVLPVRVRTDAGGSWLLLLRGQGGEVRFVNSVTGAPVEIAFRIGNRFHGFVVSTDAATEEYYTAGLHDLNRAAGRDATDVLRFCSMKGIRVRLGFHELIVKDGCLEVTLPWRPSSGASRS